MRIEAEPLAGRLQTKGLRQDALQDGPNNARVREYGVGESLDQEAFVENVEERGRVFRRSDFSLDGVERRHVNDKRGDRSKLYFGGEMQLDRLRVHFLRGDYVLLEWTGSRLRLWCRNLVAGTGFVTAALR